ncbi:MAG TPA: CpsB/CapC family capsule biosynthesis tyrosine phosphatase [Flavobacterium sp.]|nr:CpsB/CapC family capsule biosynthesis tyrosine phosphatase [Flavobacterium sp.]
MLFFSKKKPFLQDLIPDHHIDIHSHLLPGIDDGAQTLDETILLMNGLRKVGFEQFITTPHIMKNVWENTPANVSAKLSETAIELKSHGIDVPFKAAAEYLLDGSFMDSLKTESLLTLKENYILVEMSYLNPPIQLFDIIFEIQIAGYIPVLAHPERYSFYHTNYGEFQKLKNAGCKFQINLLSTVGYYGTAVAETALYLLKNGMIDYTGSDVHHEKHLNSFAKRIVVKDLKPLNDAIANNQFFRF